MGVKMKLKIALNLILGTLISNSALASWKKISAEDSHQYLFCGSNTGTGGDLIFEIPVRARTTKMQWTGSNVPADGPVNGEINEFYSLIIDSDTKEALFADITDFGPLSKYSINIHKGESEKYDIRIRQVGYRIVISGDVRDEDQDGFPNQILAADSHKKDLGIAYCELRSDSYNNQKFD